MVINQTTQLIQINNSEGTFIFVTDIAEYDANANVNSNGEIEGTLNMYELTVNNTVSKGILSRG